MAIKLLGDDVASQIAAGEVVERPASVVKELLENALDANATVITIRVDGAGKKLIEVSDNGAGIPFDELALAVARHATSKLSTAEELFSVRTLGFRGEALASIGSVSKMRVVSRSMDETAGGKIEVEGGGPSRIEYSGVPQGTVITVEDLFYNVPARLKFLKTDATERSAITTLVSKYAAAYPHIRFDLIMDGKRVLQTPGKGDMREVLIQTLGLDIAKRMLEVQQDFPFPIHGYISPISLTKPSRREITFFVNGRWVQDPALTSALVQAYHTYLMVGRYPIAFISMSIPADELDVNVHPAKSEVRFRKPDEIFTSVQRAVRRALMAYSPVPMMAIPQWNKPGSSGMSQPVESAPMLWGQDEEVSTEIAPGFPLQTAIPEARASLLRVVGQIGAAYIIAEGPDGLYLIDQHAAHERILFEKMQTSLASKVNRQSLLVPVTLTFDAVKAAIIAEQLDVLDQYGFNIEPFGPNSFRVAEVPAILSGVDPEEAVRVLVEDFEENETPLANLREAKLIARICKRAAIKAGKTLSMTEMEQLVRDLQTCESPRSCPHGRPTMIHLSVETLERQFGRQGSR